MRVLRSKTYDKLSHLSQLQIVSITFYEIFVYSKIKSFLEENLFWQDDLFFDKKLHYLIISIIEYKVIRRERES